MRKSLTFILSGMILLFLISLGAAYYYFIQLPLPRLRGELQIPGLHAPVEVLRDRWGVPHIYAANERDLFLAQGFIQAQDRLWQMELNRRLAAGRLSELFGGETLEIDRLSRTLGFMRAAEREFDSYDSWAKELLQAFCDGVNAYLASHRGTLPIEFRLLGLIPEPWRPQDSIGWGKVMALAGSKNWQEEIVRAILAKKIGPAKARDLLSRIPHHPPIIIPSTATAPSLPKITPARALAPNLIGGASNSWSVSGSRTDSGLPLLANDMHLPINIPSLWYETHLVGGQIDVIGLSLVGVPLIIAGHNRQLAWGLTFAYTDVQDLYLERVRRHREGIEYLHKGSWLPADVITEYIRVRGEETPAVHDIWQTRHGPVVSARFDATEGFEKALSLKWSAHDPGDMVPQMYALNRASNWREFKAAAQSWSEPPINLVYADRSGNIGYFLASRIPIRSQGHGKGPFTGWEGENEWIGYLAPSHKPFLLNPDKGFVATANNRVVGSSYPYYLAEDYSSGFRAERIEQFLQDKDYISKTDCRSLQGDFMCLPAGPFMNALRGFQTDDPEVENLLTRLRAWNHVLDPESPGAAIYAVLFYRLMINTFEDELGPLTKPFLGIGMTSLEPLNLFVEHSRSILLSLMVEKECPWFDDVTTPESESLQNIVEKSLRETGVFLSKKLGPDASKWRWGRIHQVNFKHLLGRYKPLRWLFNLGPYEGGGHFATVWQSAVMPGMDFDLNGWTASNRHIYDLGNWNQSLGSIVPGQSGMITSPHYADQVKLWLNVDLHPLPYSRNKVAAATVNTLYLVPPQ
jgi:penicillin amidase